MTTRRSVLAALVPIGFHVSTVMATDAPASKWILGSWQSDRELTMRYFYPQGVSLSEETRSKFSQLFGFLVYRITRSTFELASVGTAKPQQSATIAYSIYSETSSSLTLAHTERRVPFLTLYRVSEDVLFIRGGLSFEYFRRIAA